jgi:photosystem II stability/assembly factor-like uncharacterized protein
MKHLIPLLLILLTGTVLAADYTKIDVPTTATINQIYFMNDQMGWAATSAGQVLTTFDGGKTWRMTEPTTRSIHDICIDGKQGYLVGERGLLMKTTNGGATWEDNSLNIKYDLVGVAISNDSTIIICGNDMNSVSKSVGVVFESHDAGKTWKKHGYRLGNGYTDIAVYPPKKVYLLATKKAFHSINNGLRYFKGGYEGDRLGFNFDFIDESGFMVGYKGLFAKSVDHGRHWEEVPIDITKNMYAVEMFDKFSGVAVGDNGLVMYFYDSGDRHTVENCGYDESLRSVFVTGQKIFIGGTNGLLLVKERFPRYDEKQQGK